MAGGISDIMIFPKEDYLHADSMLIGYDLHIVSMAQVTKWIYIKNCSWVFR
jgi:hypothetical protein